MPGLDLIEVGLAGAAGAVTRYTADWAARRTRPSHLPWGTVAINVTGSLLLGFLTGLVMYHGAPARLTLVAGTGFCGGFTTFSTSSLETVRLLQDGRGRLAALNGGVTLLGALAAAAVGLGVASF